MDVKATWQPVTWPSLPLEAWSDTYATLHLRTQIVGKIRLVLNPWATFMEERPNEDAGRKPVAGVAAKETLVSINIRGASPIIR